ncbi:hypothetical protein OROGR_002149 [Orobanche gracilis]
MSFWIAVVESVVFGSDPTRDERFLFADQVNTLINQGGQIYMLCSLDGESEQQSQRIPVVEEFPVVFPDDILGLPPEREVEFSIDGTGELLGVAERQEHSSAPLAYSPSSGVHLI